MAVAQNQGRGETSSARLGSFGLTTPGEAIPEARRKALPGARTCVSCQSGRDSRIVLVGINRRGSKDSQLR